MSLGIDKKVDDPDPSPELKRRAVRLATRMFGDEGAALVKVGLDRLERESEIPSRRLDTHVH